MFAPGEHLLISQRSAVAPSSSASSSSSTSTTSVMPPSAAASSTTTCFLYDSSSSREVAKDMFNIKMEKQDTPRVGPVEDDDGEQTETDGTARYERKISNSNSVQTATMNRKNELFGTTITADKDSQPTTTTKALIESKLKAISSYLKSMSDNFRRRGQAFEHSGIRLRDPFQRRSAPEGHDRPKLNILTSRYSGNEHQTTLSWEDFSERGSFFGDENEVMPATPRSRKRGRPSDIFEDGELRHLCHQCDVPTRHIDKVVRMVISTFGTPDLDMIALEEFVPGNTVVFVGMLIFHSMDCGEDYLDLQVLPQFLRYIQDKYRRDMPFHNATHAADVMHTLFMLLWNTALGEKISFHNQIGSLLAAVMHDIDHAGLTNDFLIKTNHSIAQLYPTRAPMESKHVDLALQAMTNSEFNILSKMTSVQQEQVLTVVRETILATALVYQRDLLTEVNGTPLADWNQIGEDAVLSQTLQVRALRCAMHVSDISQTMKPFALHEKWVNRLNEEHYLQGDLDKREQLGVSPPYCFREEFNYADFLCTQVGFLKHLALPAVATLNVIPWLDVNEMVDGVQKNINEWELQQTQ